jgi:carbon monoxide dehydrogenase subunit G
MPTSKFDRRLDVAADTTQAWDVLTDVPRLVDWVDIVEQANEVKPLERYTAVLRDKVGPVKLRADLNIRVNEVDVEKRIALRAEGQDRQVGARLVVDATVELEPSDPAGTSVHVSGSYEVTGRVAAMGTATINKKAQKILAQFFDRAAEALGAT